MHATRTPWQATKLLSTTAHIKIRNTPKSRATLQTNTTRRKTHATFVQGIDARIPSSQCNSRPTAGLGGLASSGDPDSGVDGMVLRETMIVRVVRVVVTGPSSSDHKQRMLRIAQRCEATQMKKSPLGIEEPRKQHCVDLLAYRSVSAGRCKPRSAVAPQTSGVASHLMRTSHAPPPE